jgi:AhpD family alkylhydroperoxidase
MAQTREEVYAEMREMFGLVPTFFKLVPDNSLEMEWKLFRTVQFDEGPIPNKFRELIGIGIAAIAKCKYCIQYQSGVAQLNGATDAEIEDAVHFAKSSAGWSTYLNWMQVDKDKFAAELARVADNVRSRSLTTAAV